MNAPPNAIERAIEAVSPAWALRRAAARMALTQTRFYDAARPGDGFRRSRHSPSAEVARGAAPIRDAARDLVRNNGYAQRALRTLVSSTVGTGIVGAPMNPGGQLAAGAARSAWDAFVENCDWDGHHDLYGVQNIACRTQHESGEALIRFRRMDFGASRTIPPVRVQVLEPDFVDAMKSGQTGTGWIDRGIEYDGDGRKVALWLLADHPGNLSPYLRARHELQRVPIGEVVQLYEMLRPGQDRGISIFAAAALPLRHLGEYLEAEAMRKRIQACLTVFVTGDTPENPIGLGSTDTGAVDPSGLPVERLSPGLVTRLANGQSVETVTPDGGGDMAPFVNQMLFLAAAAGGVMFEHMTGNFENVNYSSYRVGSFDFARQIEQRQWLTYMPRLCNPVRDRFLEASRAAGLLPSGDVTVRWTPPSAVTSPDPKKDMEASVLAERAGHAARQDHVAARGWARAELDERIKADLDASDVLGVMFDGDPRKPLNAAPAPRPQGGNDDDAGA